MALKGYFNERNENMCHLTVAIPTSCLCHFRVTVAEIYIKIPKYSTLTVVFVLYTRTVGLAVCSHNTQRIVSLKSAWAI